MVSFVILHYQVTDVTCNCVESILKNVEGEKRIIIVDNDSPNGSYQILKEKYKDQVNVIVLKNKKNDGFAKGNNIGYRYAKNYNDSDFIVVMNNDMEIEQVDFIDKIYESYNETNFAILGPDIYSVKYKYHQNPQASKNFTYEELIERKKRLIIKNKLNVVYYLRWRLLGNLFPKKKADYSHKKYIGHIVENVPLHGSCYVFSKDFISQHDDCFDDGTFMYFESYILFYHAQRNNEKVVYDPRIFLKHFEDVSTDKAVPDHYKKAVFSNKHLLDSIEYFVKLMEKDKTY
ncbi:MULTISPECIES: glycosyltransferase [unclassified Enterococcus]|jgi:GT2 family glycosyltransferase|uniref:glycosyltransferase n=1 Tax=unclassified Enterococcus TaxID=2608891 RepID=UPI003D26610A